MTYRDAIAAHLKARPGEWVDGLELARIGGAYGWRTRLSDCRMQLGMTIENSQVRDAHGKCQSRYRYVPPVMDSDSGSAPRKHVWTRISGLLPYPICQTCGITQDPGKQSGRCEGPPIVRMLRMAIADPRPRDDQS